MCCECHGCVVGVVDGLVVLWVVGVCWVDEQVGEATKGGNVSPGSSYRTVLLPFICGVFGCDEHV